MPESEEAPLTERRVQKNLGLIPLDKGNRIDSMVANAKARIIETTRQKANGGQYLANILDIFLDTVNDWVDNSLSARETWRAVKSQKQAREKQVEEDIDQVIREILIEAHELVGPQITEALVKRLEERYG